MDVIRVFGIEKLAALPRNHNVVSGEKELSKRQLKVRKRVLELIGVGWTLNIRQLPLAGFLISGAKA